jgi:hypothetical protein
MFNEFQKGDTIHFVNDATNDPFIDSGEIQRKHMPSMTDYGDFAPLRYDVWTVNDAVYVVQHRDIVSHRG